MAKKAAGKAVGAAPAAAVFPPGSIDPIPAGLITALKEKRCALLVGAGLSVGAGLRRSTI
jgi:hypothetical protein